MPELHKHVSADKPRHISPWRGPMLVALVIILVGIAALQHRPAKVQTPTTPTSHPSTTTAVPAPQLKSLEIASGPTWIALQTPETFTLNISALNNQTGVAVSLEVFPKIESRSQLQYVVRNGVNSLPIASSPPVPLSQLTRNAAGNPQLNFELSETALPSTPRKNQASSFVQIPYCTPNCAGVYPVLAVFVKNSQVTGTALTEIALKPHTPVTRPLNFSLIVQAPFSGNVSEDLKSLSELTSSIHANPLVSLSLNIPGIVMNEAMASASPQMKVTLSQLLSWAQQPNHQLISSGYVPINLPQLASSGLNSAIQSELAASRIQTGRFLHKNLGSQGPVVIYSGLNAGTAETLSNMGVSNIVMSDRFFAPFSEKFSLSQPFLLSTDRLKKLKVLAEDSGLQSDLKSGSVPYYSSNRISTDLSQIYFDEPNDKYQRVVSAVFPVNSSQDAINLSQTLSDLSSSPFIKTVDVNTAFSLEGTPNPNSGRLIRSSQSHQLDFTRYRSLSDNIAALESSLSQNAMLSNANSNLLAALASTITPSKSQKYFDASQNAISSISKMISLASNKSFTVTSRKVQLPIAITSQLKVPFKGVLVISSDRLSFPHGNTVPVTLSGPDTTLSIPIYAETLGLYLISAKLFTTNGQLVVAHTSIEIRSTAFSVVSIVLTLGAFFILVLWWVRSLRRGQKRNKRLIGESTQ